MSFANMGTTNAGVFTMQSAPGGMGGVRILVRRDAVPATLALEKPTVEDIILFTVKGAKEA